MSLTPCARLCFSARARRISCPCCVSCCHLVFLFFSSKGPLHSPSLTPPPPSSHRCVVHSPPPLHTHAHIASIPSVLPWPSLYRVTLLSCPLPVHLNLSDYPLPLPVPISILLACTTIHPSLSPRRQRRGRHGRPSTSPFEPVSDDGHRQTSAATDLLTFLFLFPLLVAVFPALAWRVLRVSVGAARPPPALSLSYFPFHLHLRRRRGVEPLVDTFFLVTHTRAEGH